MEARLALERARQNVYRAWLKTANPSLVVMVCSYGKEGWLAACRGLGIRTVELQHGTMHRYHLGYSFPGVWKQEFPDHFLAWGSHWPKTVALPLPADRVHSVGFPWFELEAGHHADAVKTDAVLFISQARIGTQLSRFAAIFAESYAGPVLYKLHPTEVTDWQARYPWLDRPPIQVLEGEDPPLYTLFGMARAQVGVFSTALYEGLGLGVPTFLFDTSGIEYMEDVILAGHAQRVRGVEELTRALDESPAPLAVTDEFFRGGAVDRVPQVIQELAVDPPAARREPSPQAPRRVLMVAHAFPPERDVGVRRSAAFARYLPDSGWLPVVLTTNEPLDRAIDETALQEIPRAVTVVRTKWLHPRLIGRKLFAASRAGGTQPAGLLGPVAAPSLIRRLVRAFLLVPDEAIGWLPFAVPAGLQAIDEYDIRAIYSTSGPPTSHLIALLLAERTGLPWIADFRDPWTADLAPARRDMYRFPGRLRLDRWLERHVLRRADRVLVVSTGQKHELEAAGANPLSIEVLPNGFDPGQFAALRRTVPSRFTLTYTGTLYLAEQTLAGLFAAVRLLRDAGTLTAADFEFRYVGPSGTTVTRQAADYGVQDLLRVEGPCSHHDALQAQVDATALLLVLGARQGEQGVVTGKLFEYLGAARPIVALVPPNSEAADILRETHSGAELIAAADDTAAIGAALDALVATYAEQGDVPPPPATPARSRYERPAQARRLSQLLDELVSRTRTREDSPI
jgi:glycosyltransferase involved in cell wall biosynthesis